MIELEYYKENEDEISLRRVEPYALTNGREGWYVAVVRPRARRRAPLPPRPDQGGTVTDEKFEPRPEVDPAAEVDGWLRTGEVAGLAHRARVGLARARALGA